MTLVSYWANQLLDHFKLGLSLAGPFYTVLIFTLLTVFAPADADTISAAAGPTGGVHKYYLDGYLTIFAPSDAAIDDFGGDKYIDFLNRRRVQ